MVKIFNLRKILLCLLSGDETVAQLQLQTCNLPSSAYTTAADAAAVVNDDDVSKHFLRLPRLLKYEKLQILLMANKNVFACLGIT